MIVGDFLTDAANFDHSDMNIDEEHFKDIEAKWDAESEERVDAVDRGELQIDGPSAVRELRSFLKS